MPADKTDPPRLADALLRWVVGSEDAEVISGDLEETVKTDSARHGGRLAPEIWYWRQVLSIVVARLFAPTDESFPRKARGTVMAAIRQDVVQAFRVLRKQPAFTTIALLMLALGIGANVAIFSLVNAVLFRPLPFADPDRLMLVHLLSPARDAPGTYRPMIWSYPKYQVLREHQQIFDSTAIFSGWFWNLTGSGSPERTTGEIVEHTYFQTLGVVPVVGRTFSADEAGAPNSRPLVVLTHGFWMRRFGGDPTIAGRTLGLNGIAHTILGVLPSGFRGLTGQADVFVPVTTQSAADLAEAWNHTYRLVGRRRADVSGEQAVAAAQVLGNQVNAQYPDGGASPGARPRGAWGATAVPLNDERIDPLIRRSVLLMLAAVACLLLIVCVNLANLMLVRGIARERELAIRLALGANRLRIVRQLMTESLLLASVGAIGGLAVAYGVVSGAAALMPDLRMVLPPDSVSGNLTRVGLGMLGLDSRTLAFTVLVAMATAVLFGLGPAWRSSRRELTEAMKAGASGATVHGHGAFGLRNFLMVGEMALALVLLTAGGLMIKSVLRLQSTELGFNPEKVLTLRLALPGPRYDAARATAFLADAVDRLGRRADIQSVAYASCAPLAGPCNGTTASFPGRPPAAPGKSPVVGILWATPDYFQTLGIRVTRGRTFTEHDRAGQPKVVVINEAAARAFWGSEDPLGKRIAVGQGGFGDGAEVVGVVSDVRYGAVERSVAPDVYLPLVQSRRTMGVIFVKSRSALDSLVPSIRQEIRKMDADLPLVDVKTMDDRFGDAIWRTRVSAWLLGAFSALALVLAAVGIYGVMSQSVEQRTREIGVRMALGASREHILRLIVGRTVAIAVTGVIVGVALVIPSMRGLTALLYQVNPGDPAVLVVLASLLLAVAVFAGYMPARRATRVDPLSTLRAD
jgi:putative ABC transport system permease protein